MLSVDDKHTENAYIYIFEILNYSVKKVKLSKKYQSLNLIFLCTT